jgi:hypothetical protein
MHKKKNNKKSDNHVINFRTQIKLLLVFLFPIRQSSVWKKIKTRNAENAKSQLTYMWLHFHSPTNNNQSRIPMLQCIVTYWYCNLPMMCIMRKILLHTKERTNLIHFARTNKMWKSEQTTLKKQILKTTNDNDFQNLQISFPKLLKVMIKAHNRPPWGYNNQNLL